MFKQGLVIVFLIFPLYSIGQKKIGNKKKEAARIWNIEFKLAYDVPFADMAVRFGNNFRLGAGIKLKTKNNWTFGAEQLFIVGGKVKEPGLMQNLLTNNGGIINLFGEELSPGIFQRGYMVGLHAGKILPYLNRNPNSGLTVQTGIGFMQYKINLFDQENNLSPLMKDPNTGIDYKKGYDRLTNGLYLKQFLGYTHYSDNKLINFVTGIDFIYGFNKGRRAYLFDVQKPGDERRTDILIGAHFSWVIPIYKKNTEETYF